MQPINFSLNATQIKLGVGWGCTSIFYYQCASPYMPQELEEIVYERRFCARRYRQPCIPPLGGGVREESAIRHPSRPIPLRRLADWRIIFNSLLRKRRDREDLDFTTFRQLSGVYTPRICRNVGLADKGRFGLWDRWDRQTEYIPG